MTYLSARRLTSVFLFVCLLGSTGLPGVRAHSPMGAPATHPRNSQPETGQPDLPTGFTIVSSTSHSLVLSIQSPAYEFETTQNNDGRTCQSLMADGYDQNSVPGEPGLLSTGVMIGIPLNATPSFTIRSIETLDLPGQTHLCPVASPRIQRETTGLGDYQGDVLEENSVAYSQDAFLPAQPVELVSGAMIRSQRVARLRFMPFQYNAAMDQLRVIRHITLEVRLGTDQPAILAPTTLTDEGSFETLLQKTLINYGQARLWRAQPKPDLLAPAVLAPSGPLDGPAYKIQVNQDGLYQLTYAALQSAQVPVGSLDPRTFRMYSQDTEIPIWVAGEEDGVFNSTDYILFYGQKIATRYTNTNVYWLNWGTGSGLRMATSSGAVSGTAPLPATFRTALHLEEDHMYFNSSPSGPQNDHWYWYFLDAYSAPVTHDFTFSLQNLSVGSIPARVRGLLKGYSGIPQHHTLISLNGHVIDDHTWPSTGEYTFDVPTSDLVVGTNTLTVSSPRDGGITIDEAMVNWFEIEYDHTYAAENNLLAFGGDQPGLWEFRVGGFSSSSIDVFDITNPLAPIRIVGGSITPIDTLYQINLEQQVSGTRRYLALSPSRWLTPLAIELDAPSTLKSPGNRADYIIISHHDFLNAIQPLADYRASQGLVVKVVDVQDVYDEFSGGVFDPQAIKSFLTYAYNNWVVPAPSYVLLVGDGHFDPKNNLGTSGPVYIPPYLGEYDPWIGETASDNRLVTINGNDTLPDMFIGRLPANSAADTTAMVDKILTYEQDSGLADWYTRLTFVADNADSGGNFPVLSDNIADHYLPPAYLVDKIYYGIAPNTTTAVARAAVINAINQGRLIVHFTGHASIIYWASERLLSTTSIASLTNTGKYPFFVPMTCQEGYFIYPTSPSLAESLVRASNKGAIASWSPTGFGLSNGHDLLAQGLYHAVFADNVIQIGPATNYGKYALYTSGAGYLDLIDTYILFGDPATRLKTSPTGITLASFNGKSQPGAIRLDWQTANETWLVGFNLYRSETPNGEKLKLNSALIGAKKPGQPQGSDYDYDDPVNAGRMYYYWIELVQVNGTNLVGPVALTSLFWSNLPTVRK